MDEFVALGVGGIAAIATDYTYHRLMHVPFRSGPLRKLFLFHMAHHRYPDDPRILSFDDHRRLLDLFSLGLGAVATAVLYPTHGLARATILGVLLLAPLAAYNWSYGPFHRWVHLGGEGWLGRTRLLRRIRSHHLAHHAHGPGQAAFQGARGFSLVFPFV